MTETTRRPESTAVRTLYVAFELSHASWRMAMTTDRGEAVRQYTVGAGDREALQVKVARAREQWHLPTDVRVVSCYEAGRDGFWLHRYLTSVGWTNWVVDPASIERDRRAKVVKTDRLDAAQLLEQLVLAAEGRRRLRTVRVPSDAEEDARQPDRELGTLKGLRTTIRNRITGLLVAQGVRPSVRRGAPLDLAGLRRWDATPLPPQLTARLTREVASLAAVEARIATLERARAVMIGAGETATAQRMRQLMQLKGVGPNGAGRLVVEFFGWRRFRNGREVGALAGLTPAPYRSGTTAHDQGISKAGNARVRAMAIELAWGWVRFQRTSALTRWYQDRFGGGSGRQRRIGIVALARKLLIAFWRFLDCGVLPEGAVVKSV